MANAHPPELHELEGVVMDEIWARGESTVRDVLDALNRRMKPARAYTTILTVMQRLHVKGLLRRRRSGAKHVYVPAISREDYAAAVAEAKVDALVSEYGDLALAQFTRQMSRLDGERVKAVRRLARRVR